MADRSKEIGSADADFWGKSHLKIVSFLIAKDNEDVTTN